VNWTARNWKLAGLVVVVIATGTLIWSATERGERDDEQPAGKAMPMAAARGSAARAQKAGSTFVHNFDSDATGQLPAKFHEALSPSTMKSDGRIKAKATSVAPTTPNLVHPR
jgi:hypothetical protein